MLSKQYTPKKTVCKVKFSLPLEQATNSVAVVGEFNNWNTNTNLLKKGDNKWEGMIRLKPNKSYRFKYFMDGHRWENEQYADGYIDNIYGTADSIVDTKK